MVAMKDIRSFARRVAREFRPQRIILFGSYARGDARPDSDVDLLVVTPYRGKAAHKSAFILSRITPHFGVDIVVRSPKEIRRRIAMNDWFLIEALEQGKVLHDADRARVGR